MCIAIVPLKLNFVSWLRTNACNKRLLLNKLLMKFKLLQAKPFISYFCECLVLCKQHRFKNRKKIIKLMIVYQALTREEIIKQKLAR